MAFSRGLYPGWLRGLNNQELVHARFGKKRGVYLGEVRRVDREAVVLKLEAPLKPGDGVVFDAGRPDEKEEGGRVYQVEGKDAETTLRFGSGDLDFERIRVGDRLWKTSDPELDRRLRQTFADGKPRFRRPVWFEVHGRAGQSLTLFVRDELGHVVRVGSSSPLAKADTQPLTAERLRDQLGRLGGTAFELREVRNLLEGPVILPISELNRMRRDAVGQLQALRARPKRWQLNLDGAGSTPLANLRTPLTEGRCSVPQTEPECVEGLFENVGQASSLPVQGASSPRVSGGRMPPEPADKMSAPHFQTGSEAKSISLLVLVRNLAQLQAALQSGVDTLYCEFEDPKKYREAVQIVRGGAGGSSPNAQRSTLNAQVFVAPPRIFKMGEEWTLRQVRSCEADGYLVRNYDHLAFFRDARRIGDYSLNVANPLTAEYFKNRFGLERLTASYDLNFVQLEALLQAAPPEWFEITVHQHIPMFHMEHCVFCAFLSNGTDYTNCGRPCDTHEVRLRDRVGAEHPLKADVGCRNTVFNALAQTGAEYVSRMLELGVRHFRIEFLNEPPEQVAQTIVKYRQLLRREISGATLWRELKVLNQLGVTRGQMG